MATFGWQSTADEVLSGQDLTGKRALVTGASAGLGIETVRALLERGADVLGAVRDLTKGRDATREISERFGDRFKLARLDLASQASVRAFARDALDEGKPLHLLIANAGIMATPFARTADGCKSQFGTNHLGHFVLANLLVGLMPARARVVVLSSSAHHFSDIDLEDPNYEHRPYVPIEAYGRSKTANALFAVEFDRRHKERGVRAVAVHPGNIMTELTRYMTAELMQQMIGYAMAELEPGAELKIKSVPQGAATSLWAAVTAPADLVGGRYCEDCGVADVTEQGSSGVRPYAIDPGRAKQLWTTSEELVGQQFPE